MNKHAGGETVIGGMFALQDPSPIAGCKPLHDERNHIFLANARSGIALLVENLSPPQVWLPSYLCSTMVEPSGRGGAIVRFYEMDYDLKAASLDWMEEIQARDLVVVIAYFGVPVDSAPILEAKRRGAWVLEDACQAMLSQGVGRYGDFVLFSPRKILGVPEGGILRVNGEFQWDKQLEPPPQKWWLDSLAASIHRRDFDRQCGGEDWHEVYKRADEGQPCGRYAMSELSRVLLESCIDFTAVARRRVENYRCLQSHLAQFALIPELPDGVVPHGFPVRFKERDRIKQGLCARKMFPPVHWPIRGIVPDGFKESHRLAADIMTLPCDQRYGTSEMMRMVESVLMLNPAATR